ncbi:hypothetical protein PIROE2DRAFT_18468 [Piromyces sp. E2]|nr:hypothetical protein PIROE2DRAFT_18468 [Piromyces sp. E2]|eukprot:OUM56783.1 hypothetical protein PIROE2DRAFT_18468 [Piromyces sp. E2]
MAKYDDDEKSGCCTLNNCLFCCCLPLKPSIVITTISIIENLVFMKQFKLVFFLFLLFQTFLMIYDIIHRFKDTVEKRIINGKEYEISIKNDLSTFLKILLIILAIINFCILVGYYYATCKYIKLVESGKGNNILNISKIKEFA